MNVAALPASLAPLPPLAPRGGPMVLGWDLGRLTDGVDGDVLSADERARASRFSFERDRRRFEHGRATVRHVLAQLMACAPGSLRFEYNRFGKPSVPGGPQFNLAHCGELAVLAVRSAGRVGVDIERVRPGAADMAIAEQFFAPAEVQGLRLLAPAQREEGFFRCWARKEAFVKALGDGLSIALADFEVSTDEAPAGRVVSCSLDGVSPGAWLLQDLSSHWRGHAVAIAWESAEAFAAETVPAPVPAVFFLGQAGSLEPPVQGSARTSNGGQKCLA